jgi:hypothetical protein
MTTPKVFPRGAGDGYSFSIYASDDLVHWIPVEGRGLFGGTQQPGLVTLTGDFNTEIGAGDFDTLHPARKLFFRGAIDIWRF